MICNCCNIACRWKDIDRRSDTEEDYCCCDFKDDSHCDCPCHKETMKCLSTKTKSGDPCQNKKSNCRWHPWRNGITLTKADEYEPSWWLSGLLSRLKWWKK